MTDLPFACSCGTLTGVITDVTPAAGTHAECFCNSCRAGEIYSGAADPAPNPVGIYQTSPHRLQITSGADKLAVFSFGPKNLLRWHASCCGTPTFNTPRNPKVSFVGVSTDCLADKTALGPVMGQAFIPAAGGKTKHKGLLKVILSAFGRVGGNLISGRWKTNPLFDAGAPISPVTVVSKADREALLQA